MQDMLDSGLTPNVITYTSLMVVLRRGGQFEKSVGVLDLMRSEVRLFADCFGVVFVCVCMCMCVYMRVFFILNPRCVCVAERVAWHVGGDVT